MNTFTLQTRAALAAVALLSIACGAQAQTTIDQNKALAGNITPGDSAGFPVTLSLPGAYKLTGNLVVPAGTSGILIASPNVTLDLNGFSIIGPVVCSGAGAALSCAGTKQGSGVTHYNGMYGTTIRNGTVRGFGQSGVDVDKGATIDSVYASSNAGVGISALGRSTISDSMAADNGDTGFQLASGGVVTNGRAHNNKMYGMRLDSYTSGDDIEMGGEVRDSYASRNGQAGFVSYGTYPISWIGNVVSSTAGGAVGCFSNGKLVRNNACNGKAVN